MYAVNHPTTSGFATVPESAGTLVKFVSRSEIRRLDHRAASVSGGSWLVDGCEPEEVPNLTSRSVSLIRRLFAARRCMDPSNA